MQLDIEAKDPWIICTRPMSWLDQRLLDYTRKNVEEVENSSFKNQNSSWWMQLLDDTGTFSHYFHAKKITLDNWILFWGVSWGHLCSGWVILRALTTGDKLFPQSIFHANLYKDNSCRKMGQFWEGPGWMKLYPYSFMTRRFQERQVSGTERDLAEPLQVTLQKGNEPSMKWE